MACLSVGTLSCSRVYGPSASLNLLSGSRTRTSVHVNAANKGVNRFAPLHCSFLSSAYSSLSLPSSSSFSGLSWGWDFGSNGVARTQKRRGLVVRAKKYTLCQTKRNRSRKSLARTHGFRKRMSTTSGRALLKRRRAKGRWVLCTKSNPNSGK